MAEHGTQILAELYRQTVRFGSCDDRFYSRRIDVLHTPDQVDQSPATHPHTRVCSRDQHESDRRNRWCCPLVLTSTNQRLSRRIWTVGRWGRSSW